MNSSRILFFFCALTIAAGVNAQSFYEKIMKQNIANADTCNDWVILERSANAMQRVSRGVANNWQAEFYSALCFIRSSDLLLQKKDTLMAKSRSSMATTHLKVADTLKPNDPESKILMFYKRINELRLQKPDKKGIALLETQLESFKKSNASNPRIYSVQAYYYKCFFAANKSKRKKAIELLKESEKLFDAQKPKENEPKWGKKWTSELAQELNKIN